MFQPDTWSLLLRLFGPPEVVAREAYTESGPNSFDHSVFNHLLRIFVHAEGYVDYTGLSTQSGLLDTYLDAIAKVDFPGLTRDEKLALLINTYNAATLRLVLEHMPIKSIKRIPALERWKAQRWKIGGALFSLEDIENSELRAKFAEPRIHFAINCASIGCPKLRSSAFTGANIHAELDAHTRDIHNDARWCQVDGERVSLSKIYRWYEGDFMQDAGSIQAWAGSYVPDAGPHARVTWLPYDWRLNNA